MNEQKVPKLRFPEFTGEWEEKKLGDISKNISYGMNSASTVYDGKNKYIRITDISEKNNRFIPNPLTSPLEIVDEKFKLKKNDLLFARTGASTGKTYLYKEEDGNIFFAGFLIKFEIKNSYNSKFVFYNTLKNSYKKWIKIMSFRSGQPGINAEEYKILKINFPSLPEQEKIADFLTLFDKEIELEEKKLELLKENKKGYMQKIFSQELRFKDEFGNDYPQWEEKKLGEILILNLRPVPKPSIPYETLGIRSHAKGTMHKKIENPNNISMDTLYKVKENDFIVRITFAWEHAVAICKKEDTGRLVSHRFPTYVAKLNLNINYFKHYIKRKQFKFSLAMISPGGAGRNRVMSKKDFPNIRCILPSLPEQEKIANFLSMADEEIELMENKIEKLKEIKKGLLQQMFI
ncbi:restriction endonuclease subunit S [Fusobacterium sp. IOR10]|uniref:restriction endonuclease subunit S n=1 Tax=Fusobacterium sp. IOR10 TaxID=2665157 RepID=UPI0013D2E1A1|nr:restriction endonuclease subunit S [Fusobacterium sp. IOR10]